MKLATISQLKTDIPIILVGKKLIDVNKAFAYYKITKKNNYNLIDLVTEKTNLIKKLYILLLNENRISNSIIISGKFNYLPPIPRPPMILGLVGNCAQFWRTREEKIADYPIGFIRPSTSLSGHKQRININKFTKSFRFAVELGVYIKKNCYKLKTRKNAWDYVSGYTCVNDMVSDNWKKFVEKNSKKPPFIEYLVTSYYGRGTNSFAPNGPFYVSKDEINDPYNLICKTKFSGMIVDRSYSNSLIIGIDKAIHSLSQFMRIPAGTLLHMGTMGTDGYTVKNKKKLTKKDYLEIEIENIGSLRTYINL